MTDALILKEKIISFIRRRGPSLPVHIAKETGLSILFSSAFLSELISDGKIKTSNLRVGSSPLYLMNNQEHQLENFSQHLKSKEKEAFELLKGSKFLIDREQEPAIRVALRAIKDFAIPFEREEKVIWRYFTVPEEEYKKRILEEPIKITEELKEEVISIIKEPKKEIINLIEEPKEEIVKEKVEIIPEISKINIKPEEKIIEKKKNKIKKEGKIKKKKTIKKQDDKFFNRIKDHLLEKSIEIIDLIDFRKNEILLEVMENNEKYLLSAYNKKKIDEKDIIKTYKKAMEKNLRYIILSLGDTQKKVEDIINASKNMHKILKIE